MELHRNYFLNRKKHKGFIFRHSQPRNTQGLKKLQERHHKVGLSNQVSTAQELPRKIQIVEQQKKGYEARHF